MSYDTMHLRPGTPVLMRSDGTVQCGSDPRWAFLVDGLSRTEASWLRDLADRRHVTPGQSAARRGVDPARRRLIVQVLARAGMLVPPPGRHRVAAAGDGAADARTLGLLRPDGAGLATLAGRARSTVALAGLGRIGSAIALSLAAAGVGHLLLVDPRPVQTADIGLGAHTARDVGSPRQAAVARTLAERLPAVDARVAPGGGPDGNGLPVVPGGRPGGEPDDDPGEDPDIAVVVESRASHPARFTRLMSAGVPHLSIVVREADVVVGPLVRPGRSACAGCLDAARADQDRDWHLIAAQLRQGPEQLQETALAALAAATAAGQVLAQLDGHRPTAVGSCLEIALPDCLPRVRRVDPHPRCGCTDLTP